MDRRSAVVRAIAAMQFDEQRTRNCSNPGTGSELRISDAAAQTRIVSGGPFGRAYDISNTWLAHGFPEIAVDTVIAVNAFF